MLALFHGFWKKMNLKKKVGKIKIFGKSNYFNIGCILQKNGNIIKKIYHWTFYIQKNIAQLRKRWTLHFRWNWKFIKKRDFFSVKIRGGHLENTIFRNFWNIKWCALFRSRFIPPYIYPWSNAKGKVFFIFSASSVK